MKTYVCYRETASANYQSRTHEFGFEALDLTAVEVSRAQVLCKAVVKHALGKKTGHTKRQLDRLANDFFSGSWQELTTGVADGDEEV